MMRTHFSATGNKKLYAHIVYCICRSPLICVICLSVYIVSNDTVQVLKCSVSWGCVVNVMTGLWAG
jgi:hypothetical protein